VSGERLIKVCACGRGYTRANWEALPDRVVYAADDDEVHEQRRCHCGSHIVVVVEESHPAL
jgi:hypothetical protein